MFKVASSVGNVGLTSGILTPDIIKNSIYPDF